MNQKLETTNDNDEPELMFREATIITNMNEFFDAFGEPVGSAVSA